MSSPLFREFAEVLGEKLSAAAARARDGSLYWRGPADVGGKLTAVPLPTTLFPGSLGVMLFLASLERIIGGGRYGALCREGLLPLEREVARLLAEPARAAHVQHDIGGLSGLGSMIYGLVRIGDLLGQPEPIETAHALSTLITPEHIARDEHLDVMLGSAGALLALLALHEHKPAPNALGHTPLRLASLCGQRLLTRCAFLRSAQSDGVRSEASPMGGFCHGVAGIGHALLRLFAHTGEPALRQAALECIATERQFFDETRKDWSYTQQPEPRFLNSWCKGAPGVLLARCSALEALDSPEIRADLFTAQEKTATGALNELDDLCCGNMGRVDALLYLHSRLGEPGPKEQAQALATRILLRAQEQGRLAFSPKFKGAFDPRFFPGLSGVGYVLLRLEAPEKLPCILAME